MRKLMGQARITAAVAELRKALEIAEKLENEPDATRNRQIRRLSRLAGRVGQANYLLGAANNLTQRRKWAREWGYYTRPVPASAYPEDQDEGGEPTEDEAAEPQEAVTA